MTSPRTDAVDSTAAPSATAMIATDALLIAQIGASMASGDVANIGRTAASICANERFHYQRRATTKTTNMSR